MSEAQLPDYSDRSWSDEERQILIIHSLSYLFYIGLLFLAENFTSAI